MTRYPQGKLELARIQDAIYDWIKRETAGVLEEDRIVWVYQTQPLPPRPCIALNIQDGPKALGTQDNYTYESQDKFFNVGGQREMTVSIKAFGNRMIARPLAYQMCLDLHSSLSKLTNLDILRAAGISIMQRGNPDNTTELEESEYEDRAQFEITIGVAQNYRDEPGTIGQANITKTVNPPV